MSERRDCKEMFVRMRTQAAIWTMMTDCSCLMTFPVQRCPFNPLRPRYLCLQWLCLPSALREASQLDVPANTRRNMEFD